MSVAYYNEYDPKAAAWLRELIKHGLIANGDVDERSIRDVKPGELAGYRQCHFFAGIGGWSYALRLAGIPDNEPIWTGSCPCQPFSAAGKGLGAADERHLWPEFFRLIRECRPATVFGEQVASAIRHGWLDGICADMEGEGYACGAAVLGAHSVGAPHIRQRLYWVADVSGERHQRIDPLLQREEPRRDEQNCLKAAWGGATSPVAHSTRGGLGIDGSASRQTGYADECSEVSGLGHADLAGPQGRRLQPGCKSDLCAPWSTGVDFIPCTDGKTRRTQSGLFPLAHGVSARVGRLRGYGNAIAPQVAAEFIAAFRGLSQ